MQDRQKSIHMLKWTMISLGWGSLQRWSIENGYNPKTVYKTVSRFWCNDKRPKYGGIQKEILAKLNETVAQERRPWTLAHHRHGGLTMPTSGDVLSGSILGKD